MTADLITPDIREAARQAAREAVALMEEADGMKGAAADVRSGRWDERPHVAYALAGADAALAAAAPMIVRAHSDAAKRFKSRLEDVRDERHFPAHLLAVVDEIDEWLDAILALTPETAP